MQVFKLIKEDKVLYVDATPKAYYAALNNGWAYEINEVADDTILNTLEDIN